MRTGIISRAGIIWLFKMAWRDGRASQKKLFLFTVSIMLGIAAVVAIQSFSHSLKRHVEMESKAIIGADYIIDSSQPVNERVQFIMDSLGGKRGEEIHLPSMVLFKKSGESKLMRVRGVSQGFPFYGKIRADPPGAAGHFRQRNGALLDETVMLQFGLSVGDTIRVGEIFLPISGSLRSVPGGSVLSSLVAPPVLIPHHLMQHTGLIKEGSRVDYEYYFVASDEADMDKLEQELDAMLDVEGADLDTHTAASRSLGRRYENFTRFLNLVAFIALLLGCVGIASSIHIYMRRKLQSVAILKCLGATRYQAFMIFLIQIMAMGLFGCILGTLMGMTVQLVFPLLLDDLLPVDLVLRVSGPAILTGFALGLSMSVMFALFPLIGTLRVVPLQALRTGVPKPRRSVLVRIVVLALIFILIWLFAYFLLKDAVNALFFVMGLIVSFGILLGIARLFTWCITKFFPSGWGFIARQSLRNLSRPGNQTTTMILAIGIGAMLISTLYFTKDMLLARAQLGRDATSPNLMLLDVQPDQLAAVGKIMEDGANGVQENIPIVTLRVESLKGISARDLRQDLESPVSRWVTSQEIRATYRDHLVNTEKIVEGEWTGSWEGTGRVPVSIGKGFANDARLNLGDHVVFDVQGYPMPAVIGSIREIDWGRMQLNFSLLFPRGALEKAPQFLVLATRTDGPRATADIQHSLVQRFPNITLIDLGEMLVIFEGLLDRIGWVINFIGFFSILTGMIVLVGAVRNTKYHRVRESTLMRSLGATRKQVLKITILEYLYLGAIGSLAGIFLSLLASELLAKFIFQTVFLPSLVPFLVLFPGITSVVLIVGWFNSREVFSSPPLEVLRMEVR